MKPSRRKILEHALILFLPCYWIASEVLYARSKQPSGVVTAADFYKRFGTPTRIAQFNRDGMTFYHLSGHLPRLPWILAFPSSPPVYVFDSGGRFVEWSSDPGDDTRYQQHWPFQDAREVDATTFKNRYSP